MGRVPAIILSISVIALLALGVVILASTGYWKNSAPSEYYFLKRQVMWLVVGLAVTAFLMLVDYRFLKKICIPLSLGAVALLALCYVPGVADASHGESRWIILPIIGRFQPSEPAKLVSMIALASWFCRFQSETKTLIKGFLIPGAIIGIPILLILFETDMGTAAALSGAGFIVLFLAGVRLRYLVPSVILGAMALVVVVKDNPNRMRRIEAFLDLEKYKQHEGQQQYRALIAFGNGGVTGVGLGNGYEKHGTVPEAHTDFIFPMIGEELGLRITLGVVFCYVMITLCGIAISLGAPDHFGKLLGMGLTAVIVVPAMMNLAVTTHLIPNTGLPLPFVSYGGSSLVFTMAMVGVILSIHLRTIRVVRADMPTIKEKKLELRL